MRRTAGEPVRPAGVQARGWGFRHAGRRTWAVHDLDLDVAPGERILLAGPSGAGKSTLLSGLAGLLDAEQSGEAAGTLQLDGSDPQEVRDRIGIVFQDPETQLVMARCGDDVAFGLENRAVPTDEIWPRVDRALSLTGFPYERDHPTGRLSGGEKQRLVLAGVVALEPSLLLLDEPTANLDPQGAALVRLAVRQTVAATGCTLVVVDHRVEHWLPLVDRVVVLGAGSSGTNGGLLADGEPDKVFATEGEALAAAGVWIPHDPVGRRRPSPVPHPHQPVLVAENVSYTYPGATTPALADATAGLRAGEVLALTGPNGSGKSTFAMVVAGLLPPGSGSVRVCEPERNGLPQRADRPRALRRDARRRTRVRNRPLHRWPATELVQAVGVVFQDPEHQFLAASVRSELALGPQRAGHTATAIDARVDELLDRLRLTHLADANPFTLSGGEKRRLSVATALATSPPALVLDEPTFGQDRRTWLELVDLLAELRADGRALACVSHDIDFVAALADREVAVRAGRIAA